MRSNKRKVRNYFKYFYGNIRFSTPYMRIERWRNINYVFLKNELCEKIFFYYFLTNIDIFSFSHFRKFNNFCETNIVNFLLEKNLNGFNI